MYYVYYQFLEYLFTILFMYIYPNAIISILCIPPLCRIMKRMNSLDDLLKEQKYDTPSGFSHYQTPLNPTAGFCSSPAAGVSSHYAYIYMYIASSAYVIHVRMYIFRLC